MIKWILGIILAMLLSGCGERSDISESNTLSGNGQNTVMTTDEEMENTLEDLEWQITQYGPRDINSSFYTI